MTAQESSNLNFGSDCPGIGANQEMEVVSKGRQEILRPAPVVTLIEGFRNKPSFGLHAWNHLILTLDGRDKVTKLLQYLCRFLAWWLQQSKNTSNKTSAFFIAERFAAMKNSLATSRKAFRLGRSMVEIEKIQSLGIWQRIEFHLRNRSSSSCESGDTACSGKLLQPLRSIFYSMISPLGSQCAALPNRPNTVNVPLWSTVGNSIKSLGLLIFWAADNRSFLLQSGFLDDYQTDLNNRLSKRSRQVETTTNIANRSYFVAAMAGLVTNWIVYWNYTKRHMIELQNILVIAESKDEMHKEAKIAFQKGQEKQFVFFVALVKSVCDVLVFSNNPGVNLWKHHLGRPLHEGLHCLCGMVSASVVLYNNYPSLSDLE